MGVTQPSYIVVEGPIGVGKTTLARRLARSFGTELLLEQAEDNPFLARFYENGRAAALQTQLFFLFQRAQQIQALRQGDMFEPVRVSDFLIEKDMLFAQLTLDEHEYRLYEQVYEHLTIDAPLPDLVIYLQAPLDVLMRRIARRGRDFERHIDESYLSRVVDAYMNFFHHYTAAPLLIVNAAEIDFANGESDYQLLLERVRRVHSGRNFFNPMPIAL
ncbi:MAG: deoxyadenosine kinase [Gammaproteobacteria bacterium SG8_47]|nr:MAG: deoxyadenosine kinase [Gammaproteobacteria bacterium SG8_47]